MKRVLWNLLISRSATHRYWAPSRRNTVYSLFLFVLTAPFALALLPFSFLRIVLRRKIDFYEIHVYGEFAWLIDHLERVRYLREGVTKPGFVLIRSSLNHRGISHLYRNSLKCLVMWSSGISAFIAQLLLAQPKNCLNRILISPDHISTYPMAESKVLPSRRLIRFRRKLLEEIDCNLDRYVAMAVFTSTNEELLDRHYESKYRQRESVGIELAESVDFLHSRDIGVVLVGFGDTGKAHIPRVIPRLSEFGRIGDIHEVAIASSCLYFWTDNVGAQWLRKPFRLPVLCTNGDFCWLKSMNIPVSESQNFLVVPLRYQSRSGRLLTFREIMQIEDHGKSIASGEIVAIRGSSREIIEAHREMVERLNGTWFESETISEQKKLLDECFADIPTHEQLPISSYFLTQHHYLLD